MGTESEFFQRVKRLTPQITWERLENAIRSGTFDTIANHPRGLAWFEFKVQRKLDIIEDLRASQNAWAYLMLKKGLTRLGMVVDTIHQGVQVYRVMRKPDTAKDLMIQPLMLTDHVDYDNVKLRLVHSIVRLIEHG